MFCGKISKQNPSTNRPVKCQLCDEVFWFYNLSAHFNLLDQSVPFPDELTVLQAEIDAVLRTKS